MSSHDETREPSQTITSPAVDALLQLDHHGRDLCPENTDPDAWASGVLYDLARIAELLDGAVEKVSGRRNDPVAQQAGALATVIAAHRNIAVGD